MPEPADWLHAVGLALTGQALAVSPDALGADGRDVSASAVTGWLAGQGWTPERLQAHRAAVRRTGAPWPHAINPAQLLGPGSAAQLHALLGEVRTLTGTDGLVARQSPEERVLGPAERRLLADVPPHHGSV